MSKNLLAKYYQEKKKNYSKACERQANLSKEEKQKKQQYDHERYKNLSEDKKNKMAEQRKKYEMRKNTLL